MSLYFGNKKVSLCLGNQRVKLAIGGPSSLLPAGYTQLEYLESTGTQYIDTGYTFDNTTKAHLVFEKTGNNVGELISGRARAFFGANHANDSQACVLGWANTNYVRGELGSFSPSLNTKTDVLVDYTPGNTSLIIDGVSYGHGTGTGEIDKSVLLFCILGNQAAQTVPVTFTQQKIYGFEMWNGDALVQKLIPAIRHSDGAVGMYDTVTGELLTNAGTGEFIPGYNLPEEYIPLSYIRSSGGQRIDTDVMGPARWIVTALSGQTTSGTQVAIAGTANALAGTWYGVVGTNWACGSSASSTIPQTTKATADLTFDTAGVRGTVNGQSISRDGNANPQQWTLWGTKAGEYFAGNIYQALAYQNNTMVAHLVPAERVADNTLGLYDLVANKFFTSVGGGSFVRPTTATTASILALNEDGVDETTLETTQDEPKEDEDLEKE